MVLTMNTNTITLVQKTGNIAAIIFWVASFAVSALAIAMFISFDLPAMEAIKPVFLVSAITLMASIAAMIACTKSLAKAKVN